MQHNNFDVHRAWGESFHLKVFLPASCSPNKPDLLW